MRGNVSAIFAAAAVVLQVPGCRDAVAPNPSAIRVSVNVTGVFPFDHFEIQIDGRDGRSMTLPTSESSLVVRALTPGTHTVSLVNLPSNCQSDGVNPATVEASSGNLSDVEFHLTCVATTGVIVVAVSVAGYDRPLELHALVDSSVFRYLLVRGNARAVLDVAFSAGVHAVKLLGIPSYCEPLGELSASVIVKTGAVAQDTALASFDIHCEPPPLDGDKAASIAFERDGFVMVVRDSGGSPVALAAGEKPAWSANGGLIAFQRMRCELICEHDLWLMTPEGKDQKTVWTDENFDDFDAAFSPGSAKIAFIRFWLGPDQSYLAVSDLDGRSTDFLSFNAFYTPSWSPDGAQIVYVCGGVPWEGSTDLCLADTRKTCIYYFPSRCDLPVIHLTANATDEADPAWSHDGHQIAFTMACASQFQGVASSSVVCPPGITPKQPYIATIDLATREVTRIVPGHDPAWSPDGSQLVYVGNEGSPGLRVYRFADGSVRQLTTNPLDRSPSWRE
jgi:hypothetical protein